MCSGSIAPEPVPLGLTCLPFATTSALSISSRRQRRGARRFHSYGGRGSAGRAGPVAHARPGGRTVRALDRVSRAPTAACLCAVFTGASSAVGRALAACRARAPASAGVAGEPLRPSGRRQMCSLAALARGCRPAAKPCCLCWCCCCSCSWAKCLAARGPDAGPGKKPREQGPHEPLLIDGDAPPTLEEIQSWGQSFDRLMRSAAGRKVFREFLRGEYSEENIMFWLACEELKREVDPDAVEEKARFIYEDYISILSPKEVSLDSRVREIVNRNMVEPTPHTFDEAQLQIYTLMHRDSYPRFVNSPLYKTLARLSSAESAPDPAAAAAAAGAATTGTAAQ